MASNYVQIRQENIRKYGEETNLLDLLGDFLYSNQTHFVYELLQNAEDADAVCVEITLYTDRLEVSHDGRPFDEADVRGICGVCKSTKPDNPTKIGKFGIGFKSVYAYTKAPEVHCRDEHFVIKHYVRPYNIEPIEVSEPRTTRFVFPFDPSSTSTGAAINEIAGRLKNLNVRTLLFLRSIDTITWQIDGGESGCYRRDTEKRDSSRVVNVTGRVDDEKVVEESWLVFERAIDAPPTKVPVKPVEIAFMRDPNSEQIVVTKDSPLFVFFATAKNTDLGFLVQGPYKTTLARDNILRDDPWNEWNERLVQQTAELVIDALHSLKAMGLLSVPVLETMPIRKKYFEPGSVFRPLYDRVAQALMEEALLPTLEGGFVRGCDAIIGRGKEIRDLLSSEQLLVLFGDALKENGGGEPHNLEWLSKRITDDRTEDLQRYLTTELDIEEVTPEKFAKRVDNYFFSEQADEWLVQLYKFLLRQEALWHEGGPIRYKKFVRLDDGRQVRVFRDSFFKDPLVTVYLPHQGARQLPKFPTVKPVLVEDKKAAKFFENLGVKKPGVVAKVWEHVLPLYESDCVDVSDEDHYEHVNLIIQMLRVDSTKEEHQRLTERLKKTAFVFGRNAGTGEEDLVAPQELYVRSEGLSVFLKGNPDAWFLNKRYGGEEIKAFRKLGLEDNPRIQKKEPDWKGHVTIKEEYYGDHERGLDGFDPGCDVDHLEFAVQSPTTERSRFIWNEIAIPLKHQIRGSVEKSTRKTYKGSDEERVVSTLGKQLLSKAWLPDDSGDFHKPSDISLTDLPEEFDRDENLAGQLGMKGSGELETLATLAKRSGLDIDEINLMKKLKDNSPEQFEKIKKIMRGESMRGESSFPERSSPNVERRREHAKRDAKEAPGKKYEKHQRRSVRTSAASGDKSTYLKESYTNGEGQLFCQMCDGEMPFRKRDGEYYFESVQVFDNPSFHEHTAAYLALCPVCAAKYKEFVKKGDDDNATALRAGISISPLDKLAIPIKLGQKDGSIRFVETHLSDIQEILKIEK